MNDQTPKLERRQPLGLPWSTILALVGIGLGFAASVLMIAVLVLIRANQ